MISAQLMGGLGNQIFIYAFCKTLAHRTDQNVLLYFDSEDGRELQINKFKIDSRITIVKAPFLSKMESVPKEYVIWRKIIQHLPKGKLQNGVIRVANGFGVVFVPEGYSELNYKALKKCENIIVNGFFQCEKYFEELSDAIKRDFMLENIIDSEYLKKIMNKSLQVQENNSVCVHIRRGDFLKDEYKNRFLVCDEKYYKEAMEYIEKKIDGVTFYIFSDSIEWVKEKFDWLKHYNTIYVNNGGELAVLEDFVMMKACNHFVMSNSTLSWWAQYLCENERKIVVAPSKWLNTGYDNADIYQVGWHLISV